MAIVLETVLLGEPERAHCVALAVLGYYEECVFSPKGLSLSLHLSSSSSHSLNVLTCHSFFTTQPSLLRLNISLFPAYFASGQTMASSLAPVPSGGGPAQPHDASSLRGEVGACHPYCCGVRACTYPVRDCYVSASTSDCMIPLGSMSWIEP